MGNLSCPVTITHSLSAPSPFFLAGEGQGSTRVTCSAHWGAHHSTVGCTGGSSPAAAEGWVWHWARGAQKQQHKLFCQSFLPQSPLGQRQCQIISRNAGSLRGTGRTLQTVGICPQRSFPRATGDHSQTPMLQVAEHHHHFTLPEQSDLSHTTCSSLPLLPQNDSFPSEFFGLTHSQGTACFPCFQRLPHHQLAKEGTTRSDPKILPISLTTLQKGPQNLKALKEIRRKIRS